MKTLTENQKNKNNTTESKAVICLKLFEFEDREEDNVELDVTFKGSMEKFDIMTQTLIDNSNEPNIKKCMMVLEAMVKAYKINK